jgi:hypothetical protein
LNIPATSYEQSERFLNLKALCRCLNQAPSTHPTRNRLPPQEVWPYIDRSNLRRLTVIAPAAKRRRHAAGGSSHVDDKLEQR